MTCGIYMIQNIVNSKMYIGQAVDIERRWGEHKSELNGGYHYNKHLQSAWNKYKEDNFEFTIICECDESQLNTMEIDYIAKLKTYDPDFGYNKTYGGEGVRPTEETKRKVSESRKGITFSEEHKKKLSDALKGKYCGENHPLYGKHHSAESKKKMSKAKKGRTSPNKGRTFSEKHKKKLGKAHSIPIVQIDLSTNIIVNVWGNSHEAKREGVFNAGNIIQCCKNKYLREGNNIYKGYKWQYLHDYISKIDPRIKKVILFDKEYAF